MLISTPQICQSQEKTKINKTDLEKGFDMYKKMGSSEKTIKEQERLKQIYSTIYC